MKFDFAIPSELAHLRLDDLGYPIPFFAPLIGGKPNFRLQDARKRDMCLDRKLCPICGKKLYKDYSYTITGPDGYKNTISSDAMMHRVCAEFSMRVCPHIYFEKSERKIDPASNPTFAPGKPATLYLVKVSKFKGVYNEFAKYRLIHYTAVSAEKFIYRHNVLVPDDSES